MKHNHQLTHKHSTRVTGNRICSLGSSPIFVVYLFLFDGFVQMCAWSPTWIHACFLGCYQWIVIVSPRRPPFYVRDISPENRGRERRRCCPAYATRGRCGITGFGSCTTFTVTTPLQVGACCMCRTHRAYTCTVLQFTGYIGTAAG